MGINTRPEKMEGVGTVKGLHMGVRHLDSYKDPSAPFPTSRVFLLSILRSVGG